MNCTLRTIGSLGIAAGVALLPLSASADGSDHPYLVTTTTQSAAGTIAYRDVLVVHDDSTATAGDAATVERDRSCLTIAQRVLATGAAHRPYTIGVALDDEHIVAVPVTASESAPGSGARLVQAAGTAAGSVVTATDSRRIAVRIDARVLAQDGRLEAATFQELTYLTDPLQPLEVSGCALQRLPDAPTPTAPTSDV